MERLTNVLRGLPSHGWPAGWIGRRDRALLVLSGPAALTCVDIAALIAGDLTIADGVATIRAPGRTIKLREEPDDLLCGPCALARWVHALDMTVVYPDGRTIAAVIARAVPLKPQSPHLCHGNNAITEITRQVALLPPIDQWGHSVRAVIPPALPRVPERGRRAQERSVARVPRPPTETTEDLNRRAQLLQHRVELLLSGSAQ